jgi:protocatechuate 3,4-dioxygenase alpha subunit
MTNTKTNETIMSDITPSQTVGPYFAYGLTPDNRCKWDPNGHYSWKNTVDGNLITPDVTGDKIRIEGTILDGDGKPIPDAMIEIWQADAQGRYAHPRDNRALPNAKFKGFGRSATDKEGLYVFDTIMPGSVPGPGGKPQAPHIVFCVYSRGMLRQVYTRMYFPGEAANAADPVLAIVPADRRDTLIAARGTTGGQTVYRFDVRVQGERETVFFDI